MKNLDQITNDLINSHKGYQDFADFSVISKTEPFNYNILKKNAIIYSTQDYIDFLFENLKFSSRKYILITHQSDYYVDIARFSRKPNCIKKWYTSKAEYDHPDIIQIPIGFAILDDFPNSMEIYKNWFNDNIIRFRSIEKDNKTVYCNYMIDNYRPDRSQVAPKMIANGVNCFIPEDKHTANGRLLFPEYCEDMSRFKFVASPPGNGWDSNRTWDALYVDSIPIVIKHKMFKDYNNLPILQVNDYSNVTPKLLEDYLEYYKNHEFDYTIASLSYWKNRIYEDFKNL
jgi:hypothetical protein